MSRADRARNEQTSRMRPGPDDWPPLLHQMGSFAPDARADRHGRDQPQATSHTQDSLPVRRLPRYPQQARLLGGHVPGLRRTHRLRGPQPADYHAGLARPELVRDQHVRGTDVCVFVAQR